MDEPKAKVLEFLRTRIDIRAQQPNPDKLYFGLFAIHREDAVLVALPLFELILIRLMEGPPDAQQLAAKLAENALVEIPRPPAV